MPNEIIAYRVFLASPGGLELERRAFRDILTQYNEDEALQRGAMFVPVGWETTLAGMGRPQALIDEQLRAADYFLLVLCDRWGTPPSADGRHSSGTEEEYDLAKTCFADPSHPLREIVVLFKAVDPGKLSDPGPQLHKVLEFRKQLEADRSLLFSSFDEIPVFQRNVRRVLAEWLRNHESKRSGKGNTRVESKHLNYLEPSPLQQQSALSSSSLIQEADSLALSGRLTEAEIVYARAIAKGNAPEAFNQYGVFLTRLGRLLQAETMFEHVRQLTAPEHEEWSKAHLNSGWVQQVRGEMEAARRHYEQALESDKTFGHLSGLARGYYSLAVLSEIQDRLATAEQLHMASLEISERIGYFEGVVKALNGLGIVAEKRGDLALAEERYLKALERSERRDLLDDAANSYANLAAVYEARGAFAEAETALEKALVIHERHGRLEGMARVYHGLASVADTLGDLPRAEKLYKKALDINERLDQMEGIAANCNNLANIYFAHGDCSRAEQMLRRSLEINERLHHLEAVATNYGDLAEVCIAQRQLSAAVSFIERAREIFVRLGKSEDINWLDELTTRLPSSTQCAANAQAVATKSG